MKLLSLYILVINNLLRNDRYDTTFIQKSVLDHGFDKADSLIVTAIKTNNILEYIRGLYFGVTK